jgi:peptidoglycan/xylan/chitin deacetylase (PgdA/CDA1 family)
MYLTKTPFWLKKLYHNYTWDLGAREKVLYLTFDDGPHPEITPFVMELLEQYDARATFFCVGENAMREPGIVSSLVERGHTLGNHTHNHLNGWKTDREVYIANVFQAERHISSRLFRPPYGRITRRQAVSLRNPAEGTSSFHVVMWDVLSGDFDRGRAPSQCRDLVIRHAVAGSIIVFHDSVKALPNLRVALPGVLEHFSREGFRFKPICVTDLGTRRA